MQDEQMGSTRQDTKHFMFNSEESQGCRTFTHTSSPLALFPSVPSLLPYHSGQEGVGLLHFTIHSFSRAPRLSQQITMKDRSHTVYYGPLPAHAAGRPQSKFHCSDRTRQQRRGRSHINSALAASHC